jgi:hypothetical protein
MAIVVGLALAAAAAWASPDPGTAEDAAAQLRTGSATGSGGIPASPVQQGPGGGGRAPADYGAQAAQAPADAPKAEAVQEPTPTTPEGEQQPPNGQDEEQPEPEGETPGGLIGEQPSGEAPATGGGGFLPSTGLGLAGLIAVGFGLLIGGAALMPRRERRPASARR